MDTFVCNSCYVQLSDFRFKCICCIDYDVCQSCMDRVIQEHEDHVFLKIRLGHESQVDDRAELSLAEELTVLDAMQVFGLDIDGISKQIGVAPEIVKSIVSRMFDEQQAGQNDIMQEECPELEDPSLCTDADVQCPLSSASDTVPENNADMYLLWDTLTDIAHSDNGKSNFCRVREIAALQKWSAAREGAKGYNLRALLRINNIAAKFSREPLLQRRLLRACEAVVPGAKRSVFDKRKALRTARKKQSRSRTTSAVQDITSYAYSVHFGPEKAPAKRVLKAVASVPTAEAEVSQRVPSSAPQKEPSDSSDASGSDQESKESDSDTNPTCDLVEDLLPAEQRATRSMRKNASLILSGHPAAPIPCADTLRQAPSRVPKLGLTPPGNGCGGAQQSTAELSAPANLDLDHVAEESAPPSKARVEDDHPGPSPHTVPAAAPEPAATIKRKRGRPRKTACPTPLVKVRDPPTRPVSTQRTRSTASFTVVEEGARNDKPPCHGGAAKPPPEDLASQTSCSTEGLQDISAKPRKNDDPSPAAPPDTGVVESVLAVTKRKPGRPCKSAASRSSSAGSKLKRLPRAVDQPAPPVPARRTRSAAKCTTAVAADAVDLCWSVETDRPTSLQSGGDEVLDCGSWRLVLEDAPGRTLAPYVVTVDSAALFSAHIAFPAHGCELVLRASRAVVVYRRSPGTDATTRSCSIEAAATPSDVSAGDTCSMVVVPTQHEPMPSAVGENRPSTAARSILKKPELDKSPVGGSRKRRGVRFDITASTHYKRWKAGKSAKLFIDVALREAGCCGGDDGEEASPDAIPLVVWFTNSTDAAEEQTDFPTSDKVVEIPPEADEKLTTPSDRAASPPSILKKRSIGVVSPPAQDDEQRSHKRVRFTADVRTESKARTGMYLGLRHNSLVRSSAAARAVTTPDVQAKPAITAEMYDLTRRDLGCFWADYRCPTSATNSSSSTSSTTTKGGLERLHVSYHPERVLRQGQRSEVPGEEDGDESATESEESIELNINFSSCGNADDSCDDSTLPPLQLEGMPRGYFADNTGTTPLPRCSTDEKVATVPASPAEVRRDDSEKENINTANAVEGAVVEDGLFVDQPCVGGVAVVTPPLKRQRTVRGADDLCGGEDLRAQWME